MKTYNARTTSPLTEVTRRFYRVLGIWLVHAYQRGDLEGARFFARQRATLAPEAAS